MSVFYVLLKSSCNMRSVNSPQRFTVEGLTESSGSVNLDTCFTHWGIYLFLQQTVKINVSCQCWASKKRYFSQFQRCVRALSHRPCLVRTFRLLGYFMIIHSLSVTTYPLGSWGNWGQSQLILGEGGVHPGQVARSSQDWHEETNYHLC